MDYKTLFEIEFPNLKDIEIDNYEFLYFKLKNSKLPENLIKNFCLEISEASDHKFIPIAPQTDQIHSFRIEKLKFGKYEIYPNFTNRKLKLGCCYCENHDDFINENYSFSNDNCSFEEFKNVMINKGFFPISSNVFQKVMEENLSLMRSDLLPEFKFYGLNQSKIEDFYPFEISPNSYEEISKNQRDFEIDLYKFFCFKSEETNLSNLKEKIKLSDYFIEVAQNICKLFHQELTNNNLSSILRNNGCRSNKMIFVL